MFRSESDHTWGFPFAVDMAGMSVGMILDFRLGKI